MIIKVFDAILSLNANAKVVVRNNADIDNCEIEWLGGTPEISKADIKAMIPTVEAEIEQEKQDVINKKASGKQKLKDLGLDDEEIQALMGA